MKHRKWIQLVVALAVVLAAGDVLFVNAQQQKTPTRRQTLPLRPKQPGGYLSSRLGEYLTIEGVRYEGNGKVESNSLVVDMVNGEKLEKPLVIVVRNIRLPAKTRCVLSGYEDGEMIGIPPAVQEAFKRVGRTDIPMSSKGYQWRPYFVPLSAVQPRDLKIESPWDITK